MRIVLASALAALSLQSAQAQIRCTPEETRAVQALQQRAFDATASGQFDLLPRILADNEALLQRLSPGCRAAVSTGGGGLNGGRGPTNTLICRGGVCCGPQGCY